MFRLACIIATKDRPFELSRLLNSIKEQDLPIHEIIIVDAGEASSFSLNAKAAAECSFKIKHLKASRACLPAQRNQGLSAVAADAPWICFLDDDIVLHKGAFGAMAAFWKDAPEDIAGAVFNIMNEKRPTAGVFLKKFFYTGSWERGIVLPSGYNTLMCPSEETRQVQWLFGGATVWRRKVFEEFLFDDWFEKTGLCEDLDFSWRVGKKFRLFVVAGAKVDHLTGTIARRRNVWFGISQIKNRYYFVSKNNLSKALCWWAGLGQLLENIMLGILSFNFHYFLRAWGNFVGFLETLLCSHN
ncbi:MAG: glycosyltransferase family 2 protein [Candidatus Omnitrophica bacterium]|nr:glycosyltransferase family 2 protein [Candidatus Omnitrophota bacterium]